jgi:putative addiction module component (TIGR02574 family)
MEVAMSSLMRSLGVDRLSEAEQVQLAEEIFESLGEDREPPPMSDALRQELDRRVALLDANPNAVSTWDEVKGRVLARLKNGATRTKS